MTLRLARFDRLGADFRSFSMHEMLAAFGAGVLVARTRPLQRPRPFLHGGDMITGGEVFDDRVGQAAPAPRPARFRGCGARLPVPRLGAACKPRRTN